MNNVFYNFYSILIKVKTFSLLVSSNRTSLLSLKLKIIRILSSLTYIKIPKSLAFSTSSFITIKSICIGLVSVLISYFKLPFCLSFYPPLIIKFFPSTNSPFIIIDTYLSSEKINLPLFLQ